MKIMHLSDLHLGKRVNDFSMIEDQKYIIEQIIDIADRERPDVLLIAGDVYDKSVPPVEAVTLLNRFLTAIHQRQIETFIISGNHDSSVRLSYGNELFDRTGIHFAPVYHGNIQPWTIVDAVGEVNFYMLPFIKPVQVRACFPEEEIQSYTDAVDFVIRNMNIDPEKRNVLITHQFVTGAERSDSEDLTIGGADNVDASVFMPFDYVALGHLHRPQNILSEKIRYCGTPLKYSFSEARHEKSVTLIEMKEKGNMIIETIPLHPLHDLVELKGTYQALTLKSFYENISYQTDYLHITLTDETDIPDAVSKLRVIYHNLMKLDYDNQRTRHQQTISGISDIEKRSPLALFDDFYQQQNGTPLSEDQAGFLSDLMEQIWEDER